MLNLITPNELKKIIETKYNQIRPLKVTLQIPGQLSKFLISDYSNKLGNTIKIEFDRPELQDRIENLFLLYPFAVEIKATYLAAWMALQACFIPANLHDYLVSIDSKNDLLYFPHVEWTVENNGEIVETSNVYSYSGSDLRLVNPSRVLLEHPLSMFSTPGDSFNLLVTETSRISPEWRTPLDEVEDRKRSYGVRYQLESASPVGPKSIFRTESKLTGKLEIYAKLAYPKTRLSFFYSVADRILSQPLLVSTKSIGDPNSSILEGLMTLFNPTLEFPNELNTSVFFATKYGTPKFAFLANS